MASQVSLDASRLKAPPTCGRAQLTCSETNIILLTFLIARQGLCTARRAFPGVKIVTAAIDPRLNEMHLPLTSLVMGEAAGEGDFGVRLVDHHFGENGNEHSQSGSHSGHRADTRTQSKSEKSADKQGEDADDQGDGIPLDLQENALEGFKLKSTTIGQRSTEELKFSRRHRESTTSGEKRVWVVSPGEWMILIPV